MSLSAIWRNSGHGWMASILALAGAGISADAVRGEAGKEVDTLKYIEGQVALGKMADYSQRKDKNMALPLNACGEA